MDLVLQIAVYFPAPRSINGGGSHFSPPRTECWALVADGQIQICDEGGGGRRRSERAEGTKERAAA